LLLVNGYSSSEISSIHSTWDFIFECFQGEEINVFVLYFKLNQTRMHDQQAN
jgi:hypothetical protein